MLRQQNFLEETSMIHTTRTMLVVAVTTLSAAAGCSKESSDPEHAQPAASQGDEATPPEASAALPGITAEGPTPVAPAMRAPSTPPPGAALSDAQILRVTDLVNSAEIDQAQLASSKASDARVKGFASHMIDEHTQAKKEAEQVALEAHVTAAPSDDSTELATKTTKVLDGLRSASPTTFDKEYIDAQVQQHQEVLENLKSNLIPSATNRDVKALLQKAKTMVEKHLSDAKALQKAL
jgi:putative membrane protein